MSTLFAVLFDLHELSKEAQLMVKDLTQTKVDLRVELNHYLSLALKVIVRVCCASDHRRTGNVLIGFLSPAKGLLTRFHTALREDKLKEFRVADRCRGLSRVVSQKFGGLFSCY